MIAKWELEWSIGSRRKECVRCCRPWIRSCHSKSPSRKNTASLTRDYVPVFRRKIEKLSWRCMTNIESGASSFSTAREILRLVSISSLISRPNSWLIQKFWALAKLHKIILVKKQKIIIQSVTFTLGENEEPPIKRSLWNDYFTKKFVWIDQERELRPWKNRQHRHEGISLNNKRKKLWEMTKSSPRTILNIG